MKLIISFIKNDVIIPELNISNKIETFVDLKFKSSSVQNPSKRKLVFIKVSIPKIYKLI